MPATLQIPLGISGLTPLTCDLFPENSDTAAASGVSLTEATNRKGIYTASVSVTGWHTIKLYLSATYFPAVFAARIPSSGTITAVSEAGVVRADNRDGDAIPTAAQNAAAIDTATLATDIAAELQGSGVTYTVVSPVTSSSTLDVVQGMDYYTADGRDIEFTFVRDYVPTSCKLTLASGETVTVTSTDITESSGSGSGRFSVRFQLARTDGDDLDAGTGTFEVYSVVGTRHVPEIAEGVLTVRRRLSA